MRRLSRRRLSPLPPRLSRPLRRSHPEIGLRPLQQANTLAGIGSKRPVVTPCSCWVRVPNRLRKILSRSIPVWRTCITSRPPTRGSRGSSLLRERTAGDSRPSRASRVCQSLSANLNPGLVAWTVFSSPCREVASTLRARDGSGCVLSPQSLE